MTLALKYEARSAKAEVKHESGNQVDMLQLQTSYFTSAFKLRTSYLG
jgi:hypothetical protein